MAQDPDITFEQVGLLDTAIRLFNSAADKAERSAAGMAIDS